MMKNFNFWQKWLTYANIMTIIVGLLTAFAGNAFIFDMHNEGTRNVFFNGEPLTEDVLFLKN